MENDLDYNRIGREKTQPDQGTRPPTPNGRRDSERGEGEVSQDSTHSIRETKSSVIYEKTKNVAAVRRLLGQSSVTATSAYLGVSDNSALELARSINV